MYDLRSKLTRALIYLVSVTALAVIGTMLLLGGSVIVCLFPLILAAALFCLCFGLSFVPFIKDHLWILIPFAAIVSLAAGLILYLVIR